MSSDSNYSTPMTSPYEGTNAANFWMSHDMILDSSKVLRLFLFSMYFNLVFSLNFVLILLGATQECSQGQSTRGNYLHYDFPNTTLTQPNDRFEVTSSSSFPSFRGEVELSGDLSSYGCVSPYSVHGNYTGFYGNDDMSYEGYYYDQANSFVKSKSFSNK